MRRIFGILIVLLLTIQLTFASRCECQCCVGNGCSPGPVGSYSVFLFCTTSSCSPGECTAQYYKDCPQSNGAGITQAVCRNGNARLSPSLFIFAGITSIILMMKNKL
ncbi:unnamed protein product [Adineta steineri]|uniref:Uncharacterized protein n=1 Tax=Adineta steineri TaxID=433720 RepID=A0A819BJ09_9BILA|nr:unnamed protein product [Adineta steineri]CAF1364812.1 unnamed protein product [Adineta steineri]CAF3793159.1 unnamed protein product [Adineta steineri]CAF3983216.1 unnamed protein product [Adineta steineri]